MAINFKNDRVADEKFFPRIFIQYLGQLLTHKLLVLEIIAKVLKLLTLAKRKIHETNSISPSNYIIIALKSYFQFGKECNVALLKSDMQCKINVWIKNLTARNAGAKNE